MPTSSAARQFRRLQAAKAAASQQVERCEHEISRLTAELEASRLQVVALRHTVSAERLNRVSAQRGLVHYMREHGLADRIGYDPDRDPIVLREIEEGIIPPRNDPRVLKDVAALVVARKHANDQ